MKRLILAASMIALATPAFAAGMSRNESMQKEHPQTAPSAQTETNAAPTTDTTAGQNAQGSSSTDQANTSTNTDLNGRMSSDGTANSTTTTTPGTMPSTVPNTGVNGGAPAGTPIQPSN